MCVGGRGEALPTFAVTLSRGLTLTLTLTLSLGLSPSLRLSLSPGLIPVYGPQP